jgi:hypothetical protein
VWRLVVCPASFLWCHTCRPELVEQCCLKLCACPTAAQLPVPGLYSVCTFVEACTFCGLSTVSMPCAGGLMYVAGAQVEAVRYRWVRCSSGVPTWQSTGCVTKLCVVAPYLSAAGVSRQTSLPIDATRSSECPARKGCVHGVSDKYCALQLCSLCIARA